MTWARARRRVVFALAVALTAASAVPVSRIRFETDVLRLMPRDAGAVDAFETYLERFGSLDALYVYVEAPGSGVIDDYAGYIDALAEALRRVPGIARVDSGLLDRERDWAYLADRQLLLLDQSGYAQAVARLAPDQVLEQVRRTKALLSVPSPRVKALARRDPLGWFDLMGARLQGASSVMRLDPTSNDGYVSADGSARLLLVHPTAPPFDTTFARTLIDNVQRVDRETRARFERQWAEDGLPAPRSDVAGGHRTAIESETLMRGEAVSNTLWSLVGVLALLYLAFRSWWLVLFGAVPVLLGTLVTLALHQVAGAQLSAAATGASAMLFGLGDDGLLLLFVAYRDRLAHGLSPLDAVRELGATGSSVLLGATTTTATFLGLWLVSFPSLRQLGSVVGIGILLTALFTLTLLVAGLPGRAWLGRSRDLRWPSLGPWIRVQRRAILAATAAVTIPLAIGLIWLHVDPRIERLRPAGEGLTLESQITHRFGLAQDVYLVLSRGDDLDALLVQHERVAAALDGVAGVTHVGPGVVLPSARQQAARRSAIARVTAERDRLADAVDAAAQAEGFVPGTFLPFMERLPRVLDPRQAITYADLQAHGLGDLVGRFVRRSDHDYLAVTYATAADVAAATTLRDHLGALPGVVLTGLPLVNDSLAARFPRELATALAVGAAIVILLIWIEFRSVMPTALAVVPTAIGLVWGLGVLGWAGMVLDLFSVFAILMFLGIGVDYGIHLLHPTVGKGERGGKSERDIEGANEPSSMDDALALVGPAMVLAGATTIVGFGTLIWSSYGPLRSLGLVSVATIGAALVASLVVLPALVYTMEREP